MMMCLGAAEAGRAASRPTMDKTERNAFIGPALLLGMTVAVTVRGGHEGDAGGPLHS